jgi:hypothetical protein
VAHEVSRAEDGFFHCLDVCDFRTRDLRKLRDHIGSCLAAEAAQVRGRLPWPVVRASASGVWALVRP